MFVSTRGQTLIETAVCLPIVLLALFGIIWMSNEGVVDERAQLSLRYGGLASFASTQTGPYSVAAIYNGLNQPLSAAPCPTPPSGAFNHTAPFPGPTSGSFWQPVNVQPTCAPVVASIGGAQFLASHYVYASNPSVTATINVPSYVVANSTIPGQLAKTANGYFAHAAPPGIILYCSQEVFNRVQAAITASGSAPAPTPIPTSGPTPTPPPPGNGQQGHC